MGLTESEYPELRAELDADPAGRGSAGKFGIEIEAMMNLVATNNTDPFRRVFRTRVESWEIIGATTYGQYIGLTADQKQLYGAIIACGHVDPSDATIRTHFAQLFPTGASRTQLEALRWRGSSRAEALFGDGVVVRYWDIDQARAL